MVDQVTRRKVREAILQYMQGEIDNFAFDDAIIVGGDDTSVFEIGHQLWFTYDDVIRHQISVSSLGWKFHRRCAAFLETDCEAPPVSKHSPMDTAVWPFPSRRAVFANRRNFSWPPLPRYDPAIHNAKRGGLLGMTVPWWSLLAVIAALALFVFYALY